MGAPETLRAQWRSTGAVSAIELLQVTDSTGLWSSGFQPLFLAQFQEKGRKIIALWGTGARSAFYSALGLGVRMRKLRIFLLTAACAVLVACATKPPVSDSRLCDQLDVFASTVPAGQTRTVRLVRGGTWMVDHFKSCTGPEDGSADQFCRWLVDNSSTEFMEVNINRTLSCLQGQRIIGYIGNTGIHFWSGKAKFHIPKLKSRVAVEVEYSVDYTNDSEQNFIQFKVIAK